MPKSFEFDQQYYDRFYHDPGTRVVTQADVNRLGNFIAGYIKYLGLPIASVLDVGCGLGYWEEVARRHFPQASYQGLEVSPYLCRKFGWTKGSIVDFSDVPHDLVVCQGVLQYLCAADARKAIANLANLCVECVYLEVLTKEDWQHNCDQSRTDGGAYLRKADWYRRLLSEHFINIGGGLFLPHNTKCVLYEIERAE